MGFTSKNPRFCRGALRRRRALRLRAAGGHDGAAQLGFPAPGVDGGPHQGLLSQLGWEEANYQWIGLRENVQETMVFTIKYGVFL